MYIIIVHIGGGRYLYIFTSFFLLFLCETEDQDKIPTRGRHHETEGLSRAEFLTRGLEPTKPRPSLSHMAGPRIILIRADKPWEI